MKFNAPELEKAFLNELVVSLKEKGYVLKRNRNSFYRSVPLGKWCLHIAAIRYRGQDLLRITAEVGLRCESAQKLVEEYLQQVLPEWAKIHLKAGQGSTLGRGLSYIADGRFKEWIIGDEFDIPRVKDELLQDFEQFGVPYLERLSSLEEIIAVLDNDNNDIAAKNMIACIFVLGDQELFEKTVEKKLSKLKIIEKEPPYVGRSSFIGLVKFLRDRWPIREKLISKS